MTQFGKSKKRVKAMPANSWIPFGCIIEGASHKRSEKGNQDAFYVFSEMASLKDIKMPSIVAVSDGHGGNKYIRSAVGSKLAVDLAEKIAKENSHLSSKMRGDDLAGVARHIKSRYLLLWQEIVDKHYEETPFTEEELSFLKENCKQKDYDAVINNPRLAYGCTLLCAIGYDDLVLILQLGDGDALGLYPSDETRELMQPDSRNFGNETLSLCSLNDVSDIAHEFFLGDKIPLLITLTTDGVKNSYNDQSTDIEAFYKIPVVIKNELHKNNGDIDMVKAAIDEWLEKVTADGVGDDVTVGVLFRDISQVQE